MRKSPQFFALFFIIITVGRVAAFISLGLHIGVMGWAFAIGLTACVFITAYFARYKETRWAGGVGLVFFLLIDLWFNEFELIRTLSTKQLVPPVANFMNIPQQDLQFAMQFSALVFGAFPTIAAALLGWLQSGADRVAVLKSRRVLPPFMLAFAARFQSWFPEQADRVKISNPNYRDGSENEVIEGTEIAAKQLPGKAVRWDVLTASDKAQIAGMLPLQIISRYGGSERRARMWKQWAREGKQ